MEPATHFHGIHVRLDAERFRGVDAADGLHGDSARLARQFRNRLRAFPLQFIDTALFADHWPVHVQWAALCTTAGLLWLRSSRSEPIVISLLINGLEDLNEQEMIVRHTRIFKDSWKQIAAAPKPLVVHGYFKPDTMQDNAVATTLGSFANVYFLQFGTNVVG